MKKIQELVITVLVSVILVTLVLIPVTSIDNTKTNLYVFGVFGQSNGAYGYPDVDLVNSEIEPVPTGTGFFYGTPSGMIQYDDDPRSGQMIDICPNGSYVIGNWEPSFVKKMADSGKKTYIINFSIPGRSIVALGVNGYAWNWENSIIQHALSLIDRSQYNVVMAGLISVHGEADSYHEMSTSEYVERFTNLFNTLQYTYGFECCLMDLVRDTRGTLIQDAQKQLVAENNDIIMGCDATTGFTIENGMMMEDDLHYSQKGDNVLGNDNANSWLSSEFNNNSENDDNTIINAIMTVIPIIVILGIFVGFAIGIATSVKRA